MATIDALLENENMRNLITENQNILFEAGAYVEDFSKILKSFILANPSEFIAESVDQTIKNIKTFTEFATMQYCTEMSEYIAPAFKTAQTITESKCCENKSLADYF